MKKIITSATSGIQAKLGNIIAKGDNENLRKTFDYTEWIIHSVSTFLFGCTSCLIVPFVMIYVRGVTDANYNVPLFGIVLKPMIRPSRQRISSDLGITGAPLPPRRAWK